MKRTSTYINVYAVVIVLFHNATRSIHAQLRAIHENKVFNSPLVILSASEESQTLNSPYTKIKERINVNGL